MYNNPTSNSQQLLIAVLVIFKVPGSLVNQIPERKLGCSFSNLSVSVRLDADDDPLHFPAQVAPGESHPPAWRGSARDPQRCGHDESAGRGWRHHGAHRPLHITDSQSTTGAARPSERRRWRPGQLQPDGALHVRDTGGNLLSAARHGGAGSDRRQSIFNNRPGWI